MTELTFRFYGSLNFFLPPAQRDRSFSYTAYPPVSVKHVIESIGVPHPEVEAIVVNGRSVDFSYLVQANDQIGVYPAHASVPVEDPIPLRPPLPRPLRFLLDNHLGRLARLLRLLGIDTGYPDDRYDDAQLAQMAYEQNRIMLTRDRGLLMRNLIVHGYCLRTTNSRRQLQDVIDRFQLQDRFRPWTRCLRCNGRLQPVAKADIVHRLEPKTKKYFHEFQMCQDCAQIYWKGSHFQALADVVHTATSY